MDNSIKLPTAAGLAPGESRRSDLRPHAAADADGARPAAEPDLAQQARQLGAAVQAINQQLQMANTELQISVDHDLHRQIVVALVDRHSGEVLRQIPSEEVLRVARSLQDFGSGLIDAEG